MGAEGFTLIDWGVYLAFVSLSVLFCILVYSPLWRMNNRERRVAFQYSTVDLICLIALLSLIGAWNVLVAGKFDIQVVVESWILILLWWTCGLWILSKSPLGYFMRMLFLSAVCPLTGYFFLQGMIVTFWGWPDPVTTLIQTGLIVICSRFYCYLIKRIGVASEIMTQTAAQPAIKPAAAEEPVEPPEDPDEAEK